MARTYSHTFDVPLFKGTVDIPTELYINGQFVDGAEGKTMECVCRVTFSS
jgi:aldehyde dehydrogenase (NAD+)